MPNPMPARKAPHAVPPRMGLSLSEQAHLAVINAYKVIERDLAEIHRMYAEGEIEPDDDTDTTLLSTLIRSHRHLRAENARLRQALKSRAGQQIPPG
jgi:hypothetical protein